ncbi:hypothetical protein [Microbispora bryophytorum]|uniref:hypothetical protein n=1 Tax=Microbispora bryophytorum TaxID=1460882 RepID=UPI0037225B56
MNLSAMLADLEELVCCELFSADHEAVARSAAVVADQGRRLLGASPESIVVDGVTHLRWSFGEPRGCCSVTTTRSGRSGPCARGRGPSAAASRGGPACST